MADALALKEIFNTERFGRYAREIAAVHPRFDEARFLSLGLRDLDALSLMQRMRRITETLRATLPDDYAASLAILRQVAPRLEPGFSTLVLPDFVGVYGLEHFELSVEALKYFTTFGSSEFGIRPFLLRDLARTLMVMETWSRDADEHVRRLASEGCRPRLPWSFQLTALIRDPAPVLPILGNLRADPSLYVRKSVANHLNDVTKDHPARVLDLLQSWSTDDPHTRWIAKRALRTLIKAGDPRALAAIGAGAKPRVTVSEFTSSPDKLSLGDRLTISARLESRSRDAQRLVVDYVIHYLKRSGACSAKVFKLKELTLPPASSITLSRTQIIRDFTTRAHHPGRHVVELVVNGERLARSSFDLRTS